MATLYYAHQYVTTTLSKASGLTDAETTGIVLASTDGIDTTKPGIALLSYQDPLDVTKAEWITYTSINVSKELQGVTRAQEGSTAKAHDNGCAIAFPISKGHINNLNDAVISGWIPAGETWAYASASTITVPSGAVSKYSVGDRIKWTQTTVKYGVIVAVADTVLTIAVNTDFVLTDAAITLNYYSHQASPIGYPRRFNYTSTIASGVGTITTVGTVVAKFSIVGGMCTVAIKVTITTNGTGASNLSHSIPVPPNVDDLYPAYGKKLNDGSSINGYFLASQGLLAVLYNNSYPGADGSITLVGGSYGF
jgi:hypothetical protein